MPEDSREAPELRNLDIDGQEDLGKKWEEMSDGEKLEKLKDV